MVRRSMMVPIISPLPLHEMVFVMNPAGTQLIAAPSNLQVCTNHQVVELPEIIQVTFNQNGVNTVMYADRKCATCGQHFFCYPDEELPPYSLPDQPQAYPPPATPMGYPPPTTPMGYPPPTTPMGYPPPTTPMGYPPPPTPMGYPPPTTTPMSYPQLQQPNYPPPPY